MTDDTVPMKLKPVSRKEYPEGTRGRCPECLALLEYRHGAWHNFGTDLLHVTRNGTGVVV